MISKRSGLTRRRKDQKEMGSSSGEELVIEKALMPAPLFRGEQSDIGVKNVVFSSPKPRDLAPFLNCDICKGFLVSATTITNCLHSFCKSCLVKQMLNKERALLSLSNLWIIHWRVQGRDFNRLRISEFFRFI